MGQIRSFAHLLCLLVPLLLGCGGDDGTSRMPLSGGVQVDGVPVVKGTISLLPAAGNAGPAATTVIQDGKYEFTSETGPFPGAHHVVIDIDPAAAASETATDVAGPAGAQGIKIAPVVQPPKKKTAAPKSVKRHWEFEYSVPAEVSEAKDFTLDG